MYIKNIFSFNRTMYVFGGFQGIVLSDVLSFTPGDSKFIGQFSLECQEAIHFALLHYMIFLKN